MKLWLDDIRPAPEGWIWCKNSMEFLAYENLRAFMNGQIEAISFDHDLGEDDMNGYEIICELEQVVYAADMLREDLPEFLIHSANPVGRQNIQRAIESIKKLAL